MAKVVGRPPPKHLSKPLMVQILSHTYQLDTVGGYTKRLDSRLKSAARRDVVRPAFKPGSRFVREYHGITHVVEVSDDGRFMWKDQSFKSLSCPSSYKLGHKVGLSYGGSGSSVGLIMQPAFDVASGVVGLSVS